MLCKNMNEILVKKVFWVGGWEGERDLETLYTSLLWWGATQGECSTEVSPITNNKREIRFCARNILFSKYTYKLENKDIPLNI